MQHIELSDILKWLLVKGYFFLLLQISSFRPFVMPIGLYALIPGGQSLVLALSLVILLFPGNSKGSTPSLVLQQRQNIVPWLLLVVR
jgi:hypothetical protein